ncbi:sirohydrochlorin cobaltochelatase [Desulfovibrio sp. SGI.169]|uniref:sirohydrochlorin cobaltochelatase n=1 Tax=Desulfovibrio sp. SGI.169 TaxID=3420561 RepID=UPI003D094B9A
MKRAILLVAFGASSPQGQSALKSFDARVRARFPGLPVRWAYTSLLLRERLARARQKSDSVLKALRRLCFEKFGEVAVQPLQTIPGREHAEVCAAVEVAAREGLVCHVGAPLLAGPEDVAEAALALIRHLPPERGPHEDVVLMGHGARHAAVARYGELARAVNGLDARVHVGAMNGAVTLEDILPRLSSERVWLMPLLSVVGRHALRDMAGEQACSWRSRIEALGRHCVPVLRGTAEYAGIAGIWLRHLEAAAISFDVANPEAGSA